jgi:hypothetical protein
MSAATLAGTARARLVTAAATIAVVAWWTLHQGGAAPATWYLGALVLLLVLLAAVWAGVVAPPGRPAAVAIGALAAYALWSFLSITWATARGDAWDGANRTLLYLTVFALFALLPWRASEARAFLAAFVGVTALVGLGVAVVAALGGAGSAFEDGRLSAPVGYENASAGLFLAAFWPAVMLATRPGLRGLARGALLAAAGVLLELVVLCQSRGSLLAAGAALVLALALTRERPRLLLALVVVGAAALPTLPFLLDVYAGGVPGERSVAPATLAILVSAAVLTAAGAAAPRVHVTRRPGRWVALVLVAALVVAGLGAVVAGAVGTRFAGGAGSGRYDFWRVAWTQLTRHPLQGAGADNFAHDYARERRGREEPLYPHSIEWRTLGQTGLVGALLLAAFFVAACATVRRSTADPVTIAALVSAAAWLAHATIDWLWELPALGAPAMACLGLVAARPGARRAATAPPPSRGLAVAVVAASCVAAASYALPALAAGEVERGTAEWHRDPAGAQQRFERARQLNPLSDRADVIEGTLALQDGDIATAGRAFRRAAGRDPGNWYAQMQLGAVDLGRARRPAAVAALARARRMNPNEPAIALALDAARAGQPLPPEVEARVAARAVPGARERHSVDCRPVLGLGTNCDEPAGLRRPAP